MSSDAKVRRQLLNKRSSLVAPVRRITCVRQVYLRAILITHMKRVAVTRGMVRETAAEVVPEDVAKKFA